MNDDDLLTRLGHLGNHLDDERLQLRRSVASIPDHEGAATVPSLEHRSVHPRLPRVLSRAAVVVLMVGLGVGLFAATKHDPSPVPGTNETNVSAATVAPRVPTYSGGDLDTSLPLVGRAWADTMDFSLTADTNTRLYNVWQTAIAQCMQTNGFPDYQAVKFPPNGNFEDRVNPLDRAYAAVMGYHALPAVPADPNSYTDATYAALAGTDGCGTVGWNATIEQTNDYTTDNDRLRSGLSNAINGFDETDIGSKVVAEWSICMSEQDHPFNSRTDAILTYTDKPNITRNEIETRLVDLDCDLSVGYTQAQHDWEQERIKAWRASENDAIESAVSKRAQVEHQLTEMETAIFGSVQD